MADRNMVQRVAFAAIAIPLALLLVWQGGWPLAVLVAVVGVLGVKELYAIAARLDVRPAATLGLLTTATLAPLTLGVQLGVPWAAAVASAWPYVGAVWLLVLLGWTLAARTPTAKPLASAAVTLFGVLYAGALPAFLLAIRHGQHGSRSWAGTTLVFFPLVVIWVCDSAAMSGGRRFGGPKLAPSISPGKTRSGSIAGVVGALAVAPIFAYGVFPRVGLPSALGPALVIALVLSVLGQAGDLVESLFKREAGVKDSSQLIPGHGGVLDRFDSLYVAIPLAAALYRLFGIA
jgi:phosphatidate cytidylyltransferase